MSIISSVATMICLIGMMLNVKKNKACFIMWLIGNMIWLLIDVYSMAISRVILDVIQQIFNLWGIIEWRKNK